jgi:hypothetical protein
MLIMHTVFRQCAVGRKASGTGHGKSKYGQGSHRKKDRDNGGCKIRRR